MTLVEVVLDLGLDVMPIWLLQSRQLITRAGQKEALLPGLGNCVVHPTQRPTVLLKCWAPSSLVKAVELLLKKIDQRSSPIQSLTLADLYLGPWHVWICRTLNRHAWEAIYVIIPSHSGTAAQEAVVCFASIACPACFRSQRCVQRIDGGIRSCRPV
jgi:hypothetical protein